MAEYNFHIHRAVRTQVKLRLALIGPTGAGKTYTALQLAQGLGDRVALIDSERQKASLYADRFAFDTLNLRDFGFSPDVYIAALAAMARDHDVVVVDSLSHAWMGKDGVLEMVDDAAKRSRSGNNYVAWREVTPKHHALVDALLDCPCHLIVTMRSKMEYLQEKDEKTGKTTIRKVGLQPVQRDGLEYEFDIVADMDQDNNLIVTKTRAASLNALVLNKPGADFAAQLKAWVDEGDVAPVKPALQVVKSAATKSASAASPTSPPLEGDFNHAYAAALRVMGQDVATACVLDVNGETKRNAWADFQWTAATKALWRLLPDEDRPEPYRDAETATDG